MKFLRVRWRLWARLAELAVSAAEVPLFRLRRIERFTTWDERGRIAPELR
jgi:hypothetical protein